MLDLVRCEFTKLKRRKITLMLIVLSCFFPLIVVITTKNGMSGDLSTHYLKMRFDLSFTMTQGYGLVFLAPCLIGMLATIVSAKYCYAAHESRLHQNDRCKRFALCLVLTVRFRSLAPWGKLFQLFI
ncbi:ABC transporter permease [Mediterraneibacter sp.]|uniref:ABC transporter permease n=1 Tax=Mediterraneibacter sp. TaxID=2316022 RepID=UPI0039911A75